MFFLDTQILEKKKIVKSRVSRLKILVKEQIKMSFGKKLKRLLEEKNITQIELSKKLNCQQSMISRWMKEQSNPKMNTLKKLTKVLNVPMAYFMEEEGQKIFENSGIIGNNNQNNNFNNDMKDIKIQLQDHEIRILKLENEILRKEINKK